MKDKVLTPEFHSIREWRELNTRNPLCVYEYEFTQSNTLHAGLFNEEILRETQGSYNHIHVRGPRVAAHDQEYFEVTLHLEGTATHYTPDYRRSIGPDTVLIIAPGMVHGYDHASGAYTRTKNIYFIPEWIVDDLRTFWMEEGMMPLILSSLLFKKPTYTVITQFTIPHEVMERCERDVDDIRVESCRTRPSMFFLKSTLLRLLIRVSRAYSDKVGSEVDIPCSKDLINALEIIEDYLNQGIPVKIHDLAEELGMSQEHLTRSFKESTGWKPMEYYQHRRIQRACHMLLDPSFSITEVAYAMGFCDGPHFYHLFHKYQGISPSQYRQRFTSVK